jgi:hypothetical protein
LCLRKSFVSNAYSQFDDVIFDIFSLASLLPVEESSRLTLNLTELSLGWEESLVSTLERVNLGWKQCCGSGSILGTDPIFQQVLRPDKVLFV